MRSQAGHAPHLPAQRQGAVAPGLRRGFWPGPARRPTAPAAAGGAATPATSARRTRHPLPSRGRGTRHGRQQDHPDEDRHDDHPHGGGPPPREGPHPPSVAALDALRFQLHPSVPFWRTFHLAPGRLLEMERTGQLWAEQLHPSVPVWSDDDVVAAVTTSARSSPQAAAYWAYHVSRMGFFLSQGLTGVAAFQLAEALRGQGGADRGLQGLLGLVLNGGDSKEPGGRRRGGRGTGGSGDGRGGGGGGGGSAPPAQAASAPFTEALAMFMQDYRNITTGDYGLPWDMVTPNHRQYKTGFILNRTGLFIENTVDTLTRRLRNTPDPVWLSSGLYPPYFTKTFHYQTDGWMSDKSARIYEHATETLFLGRQDAMQRTSLLPLSAYINDTLTRTGRTLSDLRLLEVAAGTGRFHTTIKDTWPQLQTVCSDLSPFYLARARDNMRYWKRLRQRGADFGGVDGTGTTFLQAAAEAIDAPDESFDMVVCVYLFHELPEAVRRRAAAEFYRVLKPGGMMVLTDSVQSGDRLAWDESLGLFGDFNEPYYRSYVRCDLGAMFERVGFAPDTKYLASATKTLSFRKPVQPARVQPAARTQAGQAGQEEEQAGQEEHTEGQEEGTPVGGQPAADAASRSTVQERQGSTPAAGSSGSSGSSTGATNDEEPLPPHGRLAPEPAAAAVAAAAFSAQVAARGGGGVVERNALRSTFGSVDAAELSDMMGVVAAEGEGEGERATGVAGEATGSEEGSSEEEEGEGEQEAEEGDEVKDGRQGEDVGAK